MSTTSTPALSALAAEMGMTAEGLVAHVKGLAPKPKPAPTAAQIQAAIKTADAVLAEDLYRRVYPTRPAAPPRDATYAAVFGERG